MVARYAGTAMTGAGVAASAVAVAGAANLISAAAIIGVTGFRLGGQYLAHAGARLLSNKLPESDREFTAPWLHAGAEVFLATVTPLHLRTANADQFLWPWGKAACTPDLCVVRTMGWNMAKVPSPEVVRLPTVDSVNGTPEGHSAGHNNDGKLANELAFVNGVKIFGNGDQACITTSNMGNASVCLPPGESLSIWSEEPTESGQASASHMSGIVSMAEKAIDLFFVSPLNSITDVLSSLGQGIRFPVAGATSTDGIETNRTAEPAPTASPSRQATAEEIPAIFLELHNPARHIPPFDPNNPNITVTEQAYERARLTIGLVQLRRFETEDYQCPYGILPTSSVTQGSNETDVEYRVIAPDQVSVQDVNDLGKEDPNIRKYGLERKYDTLSRQLGETCYHSSLPDRLYDSEFTARNLFSIITVNEFIDKCYWFIPGQRYQLATLSLNYQEVLTGSCRNRTCPMVIDLLQKGGVSMLSLPVLAGKHQDTDYYLQWLPVTIPPKASARILLEGIPYRDGTEDDVLEVTGWRSMQLSDLSGQQIEELTTINPYLRHGSPCASVAQNSFYDWPGEFPSLYFDAQGYKPERRHAKTGSSSFHMDLRMSVTGLAIRKIIVMNVPVFR